MGSFWIAIGVATVVVLGLIYWWRRPVGEGNTALEDEGPLLDTDFGASRWWWGDYWSDKFVQWLLNIKDWFENERHFGSKKGKP